MEFTTHLELHSQATRLVESALHTVDAPGTDGIVTLSDPPFQGSYPGATDGGRLYRLQLGRARGPTDFQLELFPLHSPLLRESWLVSFPPLSYMLKSSGSSCLISGPN